MRLIPLLLLLGILLTNCQLPPLPTPYGALPSERQLEWHKMKYYAFVHFGPNTFTDKEWGYGDEPESIFNPTELDCRQWARAAKEAGMEGIVITAKHHDGFCLWPTETTEHSVKHSPWRDGQGDLIQELREACDEFGIELGIYLSPWDRNHPDYGTPAYIDVYRTQLRELLSNYGEIYEFWSDGANGGDGYYGGAREHRKIDNKTYYDWENTHKIVRELQPMAIMFSDGGPDIRWIGNERGYAGETNWCTAKSNHFYPGIGGVSDELQTGHEDGDIWLPAEVNTSIRPGWFYHASEDDHVKSLNQLVDNWYHSVGMNANFILNVPPDQRGLFHENDVARLLELKQYLDAAFTINYTREAQATASNVRGGAAKFKAAKAIDDDPETYWATNDEVTEASLEIDFVKPTEMNAVLLQEYIALGQRVKAFSIEAWKDGSYTEISTGTTIGNRRILKFKTLTTTKIRINFKAKACPLISNIEVYRTPELMGIPQIIRSQEGIVSITSDSPDPVFYYTTDGSGPTPSSTKYTEPFRFEQAGVIKAIAYLPTDKKISETVTVELDVSAKNWTIERSCEGYYEEWNPVEHMIDGNPATVWGTGADGNQLPCSIELNFGEPLTLRGFTYLPRQDGKAGGKVYKYNLAVSQNGIIWDTVLENAEFSNIANNPILQKVRFDQPKDAQYLRFEILADTDGENRATVAELGVITVE